MSGFEVDVLDETGELALDHSRLRGAVLAVLANERIEPPGSLTLLLTDDAALQRLNMQFRGVKRPTDVLSFAGDELSGNLGQYLGDIAISVPMAARQAAAAGLTLEGELLVLTVHGVLHLLGHDHAGPEEMAGMWRAQAEILRQIGVASNQIPQLDQVE